MALRALGLYPELGCDGISPIPAVLEWRIQVGWGGDGVTPCVRRGLRAVPAAESLWLRIRRRENKAGVGSAPITQPGAQH